MKMILTTQEERDTWDRLVQAARDRGELKQPDWNREDGSPCPTCAGVNAFLPECPTCGKKYLEYFR